MVRGVATRAGVLLLLVATTALAQPVNEDFETTTLDGGMWTLPQLGAQGIDFAISAAGAKRGARGFHTTDTETTVADMFAPFVFRSFASTGATMNTRVWVRLQRTSATGTITFLDYTAPNNGNFGSLATIGVNDDGKATLLVEANRFDGGFDPAIRVTTDAGIVGGWHLFETQTTGIGSASATTVLFIDGAETARVTNFPAPTNQAPLFQLSEIFSTGSAFTGSIAYDDLRISGAPLASRLGIELRGAPERGACVPIGLTLRAATSTPPGPLTAAPESAPVTWQGPSLFSNAGCTTTVTSPAIDAFTSSVELFARVPNSTSVSLTATTPDFVGASLTVFTVEPDAGSGGGAGGGSGGGAVGGGSGGGTAVGGGSGGGSGGGGVGGGSGGGAAVGGGSGGDAGAAADGGVGKSLYAIGCSTSELNGPLVVLGLAFASWAARRRSKQV